jgi:membrane protease YdiL (CAAX protease family)
MSAFIYATAIGFFSAYIAIKTKSIWFSIILHMTVNGMSFGMQYMSANPFAAEAVLNIIYYAFLCFISAAAAIYLMTAVIKRRGSGLAAPGNYIYISNLRKTIFFFNAATLIFFILAVSRGMEDFIYRL